MTWKDTIEALQGEAQDAFSRPVTFTPRFGSPVTTRGIFDAEHEVVETAGDTTVSGTRPVLEVRLSELPEVPEQGDALDIDGLSYEVTDVQPDGRGSAKLMLVLVD